MSFDIYKGVLWNDGEEITFGDLNDMQRFKTARINDQLFEKLVMGIPGSASDLEVSGQNGTDVPTGPWAYALSGGGAYPKLGSANNRVKIAPGVLFQKIASKTGNEATFLPYEFRGITGTEEFTIANGDPVNPRIDLLQMQLAYVADDSENRIFDNATPPSVLNITQIMSIKRRISCTLTVKQGTPAASPVYPAPDAGTCVIGAVLVPANYTNATQIAVYADGSAATPVIHDQRIPLGVHPVTVFADSFQYGANWTLSATHGGFITAGGAASDVHIPCPRGASIGRVMGVGLVCKDPSGFTTKFARMNYANGAGLTFTNNDNVALSDAANQEVYRIKQCTQWVHTPSTGPTIIKNANGMGPPCWTNGERGVKETLANFIYPQPFDALVLNLQACPSGTVLVAATFWIAEGL